MDEGNFIVCRVNTNLLLRANQDTSCLPSIISSLLQGYDELFTDEMPPRLQPLRGMNHNIYFIPHSQIPNHQAYKSIPTETEDYQGKWKNLFIRG